MIRNITFTFRTNVIERNIITTLARRMNRTEGDAMRVILCEKARQLAILPPSQKNDRQVV